ncbi:MAG TPA: C40 family peptidase [Flavobacterium sp.]|jgi:cell wall-associated NlpC family hydrolase
MAARKHLLLSLLVTSLSFVTHAQIVTSKKEAEKKGIYKKPEEKKGTTTDKAAKALASNDIKPKQSPAKTYSKNIINTTEDKDLLFSQSDNYLASQLINNAMQFIGVRYRGGGTSTSGMDCSGMVTAIFNIFDRKLPRSSNEMSRFGEQRKEDEIQKGDLIFFKTNGRKVINHVGMVIDVINDEIKFIHSSSSRGVIVSSTKEPYYKRAFAQVNKVL